MRNLASAVVLLMAALLASCGTSAPAQQASERLDESTGATITRVAAPVVLYSDDPARAANARDYIHAAPFAVSQAGKRSWWLWLGVWSTIDRGVSPGGEQQQADVASIVLVVDGEPMELDLGTRVEAIPGVAGLPYEAPVSTARNILLPLSRTQVSRLSRAASISIRTGMVGGGTLDWQTWPVSGSAAGAGSWAEFAGLAVADPRPLP